MPFSFGFGNKVILSKGNTSNIVTDNLAFHVDASNLASYSGSGTTWNDISGKGNNVTLAAISGGTPSYSTDGGGSIVFNSQNYGTVSNGNSLLTGNYTKSVWVKFDSLAGYKNILSGDNTSQHAFWAPEGWQGYANNFASGHNGVWTNVTSSTVAKTNQWYNVCVTFSTTNGMKLYVNGKLESTNSGMTTIMGNAGGVLYFNQYALGGNGGSQKIASASIYTKELTAEQVTQNYIASADKFMMVAHWDAGHPSSYSGSGTAWNDLSGNGNHATLTNSPTYSSSNKGHFTFTQASAQYAPVSTLTNIPSGNSSMTIEVWYKYGGYDSAGIVGWGTYGSLYSVHALRTYGGNSLRFYGWGNDLDVNVGMVTGTWYHIVAIYDATTATKKVYVNGVLKGTLTGASVHNVTANNFTIGKTYNTEYAAGGIATLKIYNLPLTENQILYKYKTTLSRF